jgi:RNA polymerase sigma factor (sigma-70 family)
MDEQQFLAEQFEANRTHLRAVAYRMLGSVSETEDAVQEAWLRLSRSDMGSVSNLGGWLTTVVARICLDMLRARKSRHEAPLEEHVAEMVVSQDYSVDPEHEMLMAESVGLALLVVIDTLTPAERIAFVLHDMFDFSFEQIGPIVGRTPTATRQLASRARRRVRGKGQDSAGSGVATDRKLIDVFLSASRSGNFEQLLTVLDPEVVFRADRVAQASGASDEVRGAEAVAQFFLGRAAGARTALVDGAVAAVVAPRGKLLLILGFKMVDGKVIEINAIADPGQLRQLNLALLED